MKTVRTDIRNIAIIAHVDHGKTTLVDAMLRQARAFRENQHVRERVLDSNDLERERGITILAKNTAVRWGETKINIVDTPGHADFGGEVERVLNMVDGVLLLVDAVEGPMPQTRFVLRKALDLGHRAVVVVNKMDRAQARPEYVVNATFDLFVDLGATDEQADFEVIYTNALSGQASTDPIEPGSDLTPLFEAILRLPAPAVEPNHPLQLLVTSLDYDDYKGRIAIGRVRSGLIRRAQEAVILTPTTTPRRARIAELFIFENLGRTPVETAEAGEIVAITGLSDVGIGETVADREQPRALPPISVEAPTVRMAFMVNNSPFAGREGDYVTSRVLRERLFRELERNVALRVEETASPDTFLVSGRGELHLAILIETMRREGYELAVGKPEVITREIDGQLHEPVEVAEIEVAEEYVGTVVEMLGKRRGRMADMRVGEDGTNYLTYLTPTRGMLGFRGQFLTATRGTGIMHTLFHGYEPWFGEMETRETGSLVAYDSGISTAYALDNAQLRGQLFIGPGVEIYEGMVIGRYSRPGDLALNACKKKHLTNMRNTGSEAAILLTPPIILSLDDAIEYIAEDELVEATPKSIRLRKKELNTEKRVKQTKREKEIA
ncbi:MAG: translational GTPase TypA [Ardenticatenaceae bacterium]|nr:translational GTPase TypA [Ardenticatenaceae bacterium]HBY92849.1 translational GTPase TypA [Chloroflexota bacterium]